MIHILHCSVCSNCVSVCSQGHIVVIKELDYEISNGHYVLTVTATDQCPIPQFRLTSSTTVSSYLLHTYAVVMIPLYHTHTLSCTTGPRECGRRER